MRSGPCGSLFLCTLQQKIAKNTYFFWKGRKYFVSLQLKRGFVFAEKKKQLNDTEDED